MPRVHLPQAERVGNMKCDLGRGVGKHGDGTEQGKCVGVQPTAQLVDQIGGGQGARVVVGQEVEVAGQRCSQVPARAFNRRKLQWWPAWALTQMLADGGQPLRCRRDRQKSGLLHGPNRRAPVPSVAWDQNQSISPRTQTSNPRMDVTGGRIDQSIGISKQY